VFKDGLPFDDDRLRLVSPVRENSDRGFPLNLDSLDLVERDLVSGSIVELRRAPAFMPGRDRPG
jgi:hypothetical protein